MLPGVPGREQRGWSGGQAVSKRSGHLAEFSRKPTAEQ